jgi:translocation and assembly module TamB
MRRFTARLRRFSRYFFLGCLLFLLSVSGFLWYITTDSFQQMVRGRLVAAMERATGGRAELGSFHVVPLRFQVEVRDLTIHGREAPGQTPLLHVDSMSAIVNLSSVLGARIAFHKLTLHHPVVHLILYPDGTTNRPTPAQNAASFEQLFSISVDKLAVEQGELLWQDERIPFGFVTNDVSASLGYSFLHRRYSGNVSVGKAETQLQNHRPFAWTGKADFAIDSGGIQVRSLLVDSGRSRLQAKGTVTNFAKPVFKGNYDLVLDLQQAGEVARQPALQAGVLETKGDGTWSGQNFSSTGTFDLRDLSWQDKTFNVRNLAAAGKFSLDPERIAVSQVTGQVFRGNFASDGELSTANTAPNKRRNSSEPSHGTVNIKFRDFSLSEILPSLGQRFRPASNLKFAGNASGTSQIRWKDSVHNAEISTAFTVERPARLAPGQVPVIADIQATYILPTNAFRVRSFSANTPGSQLRASGELLSAAPLRFSFATTDLREWQPVTAALFPTGLPANVHGRVGFNGSATGGWARPNLAGHLQLLDFDTPIQGRSARPESLHWDSLNADVQLSENVLSMHNAAFHGGNTSLKIDGTVGLRVWKTAPDSPIRLRVDATGLDAAQAARLSDCGVAASGQLNASLSVSGMLSSPSAQGTLTLSKASLQGHTFDSAHADVALNGNLASFRNLLMTRGETQLSGSGAYDLSGHRVEFDITGANFDLAEFAPPQISRIRVGGKLDFSARASGNSAAPDVNAHLHFKKVSLNDELAGDYFMDAVTRGADLHLTGHSDFQNAELLMDGDVRLRELWPAHINLHFTRLDVDSFLQGYLHAHITGHSAAAGELVLQGPLRDLQKLTLTGTLTDLYTEIQKVKLRNNGPIQFALSNQELKVNSFHILGEDTDFFGAGSMQLAGERRLDFQAQGKVGLRLIQHYDPDFTASGMLSGESQIGGTVDAPQVKGKLQVENGAIADVNLPSALSEINGNFSFSQNQISIENLSARTGGGAVNFSGHAELVGKQINFDLGATANAVRLRYPPGVSSTADANLRWAGSSAGSLLSGDITVTKLGVTPGFDFGAYLERTVQAASLPQTDPLLNKIHLDLHVVTAPELQMQTSVLRLRGEADLRVRGNAAKPVLLGRADVFEGEAYFGGTKYRLERGGVTFTNPAVTTPFLDLEATTRVRDYDIILSMTGPADKPKLNYRSEPPLPTADIITLLAFGQTSETSAQLQQTNQSVFSQQASSAMLTAALNATLNNRTQRLFGNSSIKIDPQGLDTETSPTQTGPAVTIEQQVKDNLTVAYTTDVAQTSQQVIRAEYNVSRNVSIVAIRDQYGVVSFDVKIRRRKR